MGGGWGERETEGGVRETGGWRGVRERRVGGGGVRETGGWRGSERDGWVEGCERDGWVEGE